MNESCKENPESVEFEPKIAIDMTVPLGAVQRGLTLVGPDKTFQPVNPNIRSISIDNNGVISLNDEPTDTQLILEEGRIKVKFFKRQKDGTTSIGLFSNRDSDPDRLNLIDAEQCPELIAISPIIHMVVLAHILETRSALLKTGSFIPSEEQYIMVKRVPLSFLRTMISRILNEPNRSRIKIADDGRVTLDGELLFNFRVENGSLEVRHDLVTDVTSFPYSDFREECFQWMEVFMKAVARALEEFQE